jgi:putative addiction module component (TIGR02574 family)
MIDVMTEPVRRLVEEAMKLSVDERAQLVAELQTSLDDIDEEWLEELERRANEALKDPNRGSTWAEVRARIEAKRSAP